MNAERALPWSDFASASFEQDIDLAVRALVIPLEVAILAWLAIGFDEDIIGFDADIIGFAAGVPDAIWALAGAPPTAAIMSAESAVKAIDLSMVISG